jgi:hypothetical protein
MNKVFIFLFFIVTQLSFSQMNWINLPQTTNGEVMHLNIYNNKLIATGKFTQAGNVKANNIAAWDGSNWTALGNGIRGSYVYRTLVFNNELYAVGDFDSAGTVASSDVAKWNGTNWIALNSNADGRIYGIDELNGEIYVSGNFSVTSGVATKNVAKLTGTGWQQVGQGLPVFPQGIYNLIKYNNRLYATGDIKNGPNAKIYWIKVLNGNNWDSVGVGGVYGLSAGAVVWKNKLLIAPLNPTLLPQWNDTAWSTFSTFNYFIPKRYGIISNTLYCVGENYNSASNVAFWDELNNTWNIKGSGVNGNIRGIIEFNGELYVSGDFDATTGVSNNYIAKWALANGIDENKTSGNDFIISPNPVLDFLGIKSSESSVNVTILSEAGETISTLVAFNTNENLNLSALKAGVYIIKIESKNQKKTIKIIKK